MVVINWAGLHRSAVDKNMEVSLSITPCAATGELAHSILLVSVLLYLNILSTFTHPDVVEDIIADSALLASCFTGADSSALWTRRMVTMVMVLC